MKIGKVVSINYSQIKVKISSEIKGGSVNISGAVYYFGNIGSYLKIENALKEEIVCEVVSIFDSDSFEGKMSFDMESNREILLKPVGTISNRNAFVIGVGVYPSLYSDVSIITQEDMKTILSSNSSEDDEVPNSPQENVVQKSPQENVVHKDFRLGTSKNLINYPIDISVNKFFNMHSAVLGNSGSGKSNTIAYIIQQIHRKIEYSALGSKIILFDVNGEYKQAFPKDLQSKISVNYFKPNVSKEEKEYKPFYLPHFVMSLDEWSSFLLATDATQRPFWNKVLQESYRFYKIGSADQQDQNKFINYLRYRVCSMVFSCLRQAESDTARITTAASVLGSILNIIRTDKRLSSISQDLVDEIEGLQRACAISYGENHGQLEEATNKVAETIDPELALQVLSKSIQTGEYFDYQFLKIAAELILLEEDAKGNKQLRGFTSTMLTRLDYFLENNDCEFMRDVPDIDSIGKYLEFIWGGTEQNANGSQLVIIDTSELGPEILETLTSVVSRLIFDERKKLVGNSRREKPIHLILDEAHRYIKKDYSYILKENIFEKISREGRKYSYYLMISSQRPSELSETVLSQCANFVVHRIQNERDMKYIQAILPYFSEDFTSKIKQSVPGEALVFGNCVSMPLHIKVERSSPVPDSENCNIAKEWFIEG